MYSSGAGGGGHFALQQLQELLRLRTASLETAQQQVVELSAELGLKRVTVMVCTASLTADAMGLSASAPRS